MAFAVCYASGQIEVVNTVQRGAIPFAKGDEAELRQMIQGTARRAYDNETYLVPGVPEAEDEIKALEAVLTWRDNLFRNPDNRRLLVVGRIRT